MAETITAAPVVTETEQRMLDTVTIWPDFSGYGAELLLKAGRATQDGPAQKFYILSGAASNPLVLKALIEAKKLGGGVPDELGLSDFDLKNVPGAGPMLIASYKKKLSAASFQQFLPLVNVRSFNFYQVTHGAKALSDLRSKLAAVQAKEQLLQASIFEDKQPIGFNPSGEAVYDLDGVRTIRLPDGAPLAEDESGAARFLRFGAGDTIEANQALIHDLAQGLRTSGRENINAWMDKVFGEEKGNVSPVNMGDSYDVALRQYLASSSLTPAERFETSIAMLERKPSTFITRTVNQEAIDYKAPIPIGVLGAVLLGPEENVSGQSVFVPAAGTGTLLTGIPAGANIIASEMNEASLQRLQAVATARGFEKPEVYAADATKADFPNTKFVLAQPPANHRAQEVVSGVATTRIDYQIMLRSLEARDSDGRGVFILGGDETKGEIEGQSRDVLEYVYSHYEVEALAEINGSVFSDRVGTQNQRILIVGERRAQPVAPKLPESLSPLMTYDDLWGWTQTYLDTHFDAAFERSNPTDEASESAVTSNPHQKRYRSASAGDVSTMIPRNLEGPSVIALERVVKDLGDVDELVKGALGWTDEELYSRLAGEQIDALAMQIHANRRNRGFMIADETGIGKGRVNAAAAVIELMAGETVVVVTEATHHFRDVFNDFKAIGAEHMLRPFMFNHDVDIKDAQSGDVLIPATSLDEVESVINQGALPEKYNIVFLTYSQINKSADMRTKKQIKRDLENGIDYAPGALEPRDAEKLGTQKARLFQRVTDGSFLVLDEAHNSAGDSATGRNVEAGAILAKNVLYASASPATTIRNVGSYFRLFPEGMSASLIGDVLKKGGEIMMEQYAQSLAEDGVYIRREHDKSDVEERLKIATADLARNEHYANEIASVYQMFVLISGELDKVINHQLQEFNERFEQLDLATIRGRYQGMASSNFGSRLHLMNRIMTAALTADATIREAVEALDNGQKPFLPLDVTMGSLLKQIQEAHVAQYGLETQGKMKAPDMKDILRFNLQKMLDIPDFDLGDGHFEQINVTEPQIMALYELGMERINELPDLPVSIIDYIKEGIEKEGYTVEEISGRGLAFKNGSIVKHEAPPKLEAVDRFNSGQTHALISTSPNGYGVQADASFGDQSQRHYIESLLPQDGKKGWQRKGRVMRRGETSSPVYTTISSGLPAAQRLALIHRVHDSRLAANTMADKRSRLTEQGSFEIDLLSSAGNAVALRLLEENPELQTKFGVRDTLQRRLGAEDFKLQPHDRTYVGWFFSKIGVLPINEQKYWIATLEQAYKDHVMDLKARGLSLDTSVMTGTFRILDRQLYDYGDINDVDSVFSKPIYLTTLEGSIKQDPIRSAELLSMVDRGDQRLGINRSEILDAENYIARNKDRFLEAFWDSKQGTFAEAIENPDTKVGKKNASITWLQDIIKHIKPGSEISFSDSHDEEIKNAVITSIRVPSHFDEDLGKNVKNEKRYTSASAWQITFLVPGEKHERTSTLRVMSGDPSFELRDGLHGPAATKDAILAAYDNAPSGVRRFTRKVLTGNMFGALKKAIDDKLGSPVYYQDADGVRHSAILLNKRNRDLQLKAAVLPYAAVRDYSALHPNAQLAPRITSHAAGKGFKQLELYTNNEDRLFVNLPTGPLSRRLRSTTAFKDLQDRMGWGRGRSSLDISDELPAFTEALKQAGIQLFVPNTDRNWVNDWVSHEREARFEEMQRRQFGIGAAGPVAEFV